MKLSLMSPLVLLLLATAPAQSQPAPANRQDTPSAQQALTLAIQQIDTLRLPRNKVYLDRQAAAGLAATQPAQAIALLQQALAALDQATANERQQKHPDAALLEQLDFARRPVLLQLVHLSPAQGLAALRPAQSADDDTEFQRLVFEQVYRKVDHNSTDSAPAAAAPSPTQTIADAARAKLASGATPAAVAAYSVLQQHDPIAAHSLASDIVARLGQQKAADSPEAVQAAFALLRLVRSDAGTRSPEITVNPSLLADADVQTLFQFIGDAFLAAGQPELLVLPEAPRAYLAALDDYAPAKAEAVRQLPFAAPDAKSLIFSPDSSATTADTHLTAEQQTQQQKDQASQQVLAQQQLSAQVQQAAAQFVILGPLLADPAQPPRQVQQALDQTIAAVNQCLSTGRALTPTLQPEAFQQGEFEFYSDGPLTGVLASITSLLAVYAQTHPREALAAASTLDGPAVQTGVTLSLALHLATQPPVH